MTVAELLLMISGDVETNPGPVRPGKVWQCVLTYLQANVFGDYNKANEKIGLN